MNLELIESIYWLIPSMITNMAAKKNKSTSVQKCLSNMDLPCISETGSVWDAPGF